MSDLLEKIAECVERGKVNLNAPYPPDMKGQPGADELTLQALEAGIAADDILKKAFMVGMNKIGEKFSTGKAFIPELLMSAKAMNAAMVHLKPYFDSGEARLRGTVILGTVFGDLHDIGKNIVKMVLEGDGWKVIDLGVNTTTEKFLQALKENPDSFVGLSALLTTTMINMEDTVQQIKDNFPGKKVFIGGAPVTSEFASKIGADGYFPDPHKFARHLSDLQG